MDYFNRYFAAISVVLLGLTASFNVGYFYVVGSHFIGVMDIGNVVYSFGLVFMGVLLACVFLSAVADGIIKYSGIGYVRDYMIKDRSRKEDIVFALLVGLPTMGFLILARDSPYFFFGSLFIVVCLVIYFVTLIYFLWEKSQYLSIPAAVIVCAILCGTCFCFGIYIARHEAYETNDLYDVSTKQGNFNKVRLVRSSSSGFIISRDRGFVFVPSGELRLISTVHDKQKSPHSARISTIVGAIIVWQYGNRAG